MSYIINRFNGTELLVLNDGTIDTTTSLGLVGRNYVGYGEVQNENFVYLLENFANDFPPPRPILGQTWYDTINNVLNVYKGDRWLPVGNAEASTTEPTNSSIGSLWLKIPDNQIYVYDGQSWVFVGPESVNGFGITRARATTLLDIQNQSRPVILFTVDDIVIAIASKEPFTISPLTAVTGFDILAAGITISSQHRIKGNLQGLADSASKLEISRTINGVPFDGTNNITIKSSTTNFLRVGDYLIGSNFDGSLETEWSVDATSSNSIGKVVARDSQGNFEAGTITANLVGDVQGNVNSAFGISRFNIVEANQFIGATLSGNAATATRLRTGRFINGVLFDGTLDITVTAAATTLTGSFINSSVTESSLTKVGTLTNLEVEDQGITIGNGQQLRLLIDSGVPTVRSTAGQINFDIGTNGPDISFINPTTSVSLGGPNAPAIIGDNTTNLGINGYRFDNIYANNLLGNAATADLASRADNLTGGSTGSIPYQTTAGSTAMLPVGTQGQILRVTTDNQLTWFNATTSADIDSVAVRDSNGDIFANFFRGTAVTAQYADLAEYYAADQEYDEGTVLVFGGTAEVTVTDQFEDTRVAGIVSTNPAYIMNSNLEGIKACVALQGRVLVKIVGKIQKGNFVTTSTAPGVGTKAINPKFGTILGKALQDKDTDEVAMIEVAVSRM